MTHPTITYRHGDLVIAVAPNTPHDRAWQAIMEFAIHPESPRSQLIRDALRVAAYSERTGSSEIAAHFRREARRIAMGDEFRVAA